MKIKEVIVVEGKHDKDRIHQCVQADVITSSGTHVSKSFLKQCKQLNEERGIIIFTDPDHPGELIRRKIMAYVGDCKHASLNVKQSKRNNKVGIEHASCEVIVQALEKTAEFIEKRQSLSYADFLKLGLSGQKNSQARRDSLSAYFSFPRSNSKTTFKYLNMMGITYASCIEVLGDDD